MPNIRLSAMSGDTYTIDSSDPKTLAAWFMETLPKVVDGSPAYNEARVIIYPCWTGRSPRRPDGTPDWPIDPGYPQHVWTAAQIERVAEVLRAIAAEV